MSNTNNGNSQYTILKCSACGAEVASSSKFCSNCGQKLTSGFIRAIDLQCPNCGGPMERSSDGETLICHYCGATKLLVESDDVKIAQIQTDAQHRIEIEKIRSQQELEREANAAAIEVSREERKRERYEVKIHKRQLRYQRREQRRSWRQKLHEAHINERTRRKQETMHEAQRNADSRRREYSDSEAPFWIGTLIVVYLIAAWTNFHNGNVLSAFVAVVQLALSILAALKGYQIIYEKRSGEYKVYAYISLALILLFFRFQ